MSAQSLPLVGAQPHGWKRVGDDLYAYRSFIRVRHVPADPSHVPPVDEHFLLVRPLLLALADANGKAVCLDGYLVPTEGGTVNEALSKAFALHRRLGGLA